MKLTKKRARKPLVDGGGFSRGWSQPSNEPKNFNIGIGGSLGDYRLIFSREEAEAIRDWLTEELAKD
jgi:hypothetical protein